MIHGLIFQAPKLSTNANFSVGKISLSSKIPGRIDPRSIQIFPTFIIKQQISANLSSFMLNRMCVHVLSCVQLLVTLWTVAPQAPLSTEFSRQECWSGVSFPYPGDLLKPGIEPVSSALAGGFFSTIPPGLYFPPNPIPSL